MNLIIVLLALIINHEQVLADLQRYSFIVDTKETVIFYDPNKLSSSSAFVATHASGNRLFATQVEGTIEFDYQDATCTAVRTNSIVIGPQASSNDGVISNRVSETFEDAVVLQNRIERLFSVRADSSECIREGGDVKTCLGPLFVFREGISRPIPITNQTLLRSTGVGTASGVGYGCGTPAITYLDITLPKLLVETDCEDDFAQGFTGVYAPTDVDPFILLDITDAYAREEELVQHRLVLRRFGYDFYFQLADITGVLDYEVFFTSADPVPSDFEYYLPLSLESNSSACRFNISLQSVELPLTLNPRETLTPLNYYQNRLPLHYEKTLACGFELCRLKQDGSLATPNCPEGEYRGGCDRGVIASGTIDVPVEIPADESYKHYVEECESFFPWDTVFQVFDGVSSNTAGEQFRQVGFMCRAPYYYASEIGRSVNPEDEKNLQCFKMGGWVMGTTRNHCGRQSDMRKCEVGYVFFDGWCYYKFDYDIEADSYVPESRAEVICEKLGSDVSVFQNPTVDESQWIQNVYVGWKRKSGGYPYRVRVQSNLCECYDFDPTSNFFPPISVEFCSCQNSFFPICRYKKESRVIPHEEISMCPLTHQLMHKGSKGIPWLGVPRKCECGLGSTGPYCNTGTCPSFLDVQSSEVNTELSDFFGKCYFQNRGGCADKNPNTCQCFENYAPPASLNPLSPLNKFSQFPCACPSSGDPKLGEFGFQINDERYLEKYAICGGVERGRCLLEESTTLSRCECILRTDLSEGLIRRNEPAMNGKACEGRVAVKPAQNFFVNGLVTEGYCNSHGTVCSSGEGQRDEIVEGQDVSFYWRTVCLSEALGDPISGCACDNGWTGDSCTCPIPEDRALDLVVLRDTNLNYIEFMQETTVAYVAVRPVRYDSTTIAAGCTAVSVSTSAGLRTEKQTCEFQAGNGWNTEDRWFCYFNKNYFVEVQTLETLPECEIEVFSDTFSPCGNFTNPTSGRFSANEFNRGQTLVLEKQPIQYAPFGCTTSECMCDENHTGGKCRFAISSLRRDEDGEFSARVCGEDSEPARGEARADEDSCKCLETFDFNFVGGACQCANQYVPQLGERVPCNAHGDCIEPSFPLGMCGFDVDDLEGDSLSTPFSFATEYNVSRVYTVQERNPSIWDNYGEGDRRSVFTIEGRSWLFETGDQLVFDSVFGNISTCAPRVRFPLNLTYECGVNSPVRGLANVTIWSLDTSFDFSESYELCDPSVFNDLDPSKCSVGQFCKEEWILKGSINETDVQSTLQQELRQCISRMVWQPIPSSLDILESGFYENVHAICAEAPDPDQNNTEIIEFSYDLFDCSNPVDRLLDDAVFLIVGNRQCNQTIGPYDKSIGEGYGLFFNQIPSLSFVQESLWTDEHYAFISSLIGNERCSEDVFDETMMNEIIQSWIVDNTQPLADLTSNSTDPLVHVFNNDRIEDRPNNWEVQGLYGSRVLKSLATWPTLIGTENYTWSLRDGNFAFLPNFDPDTSVTKLIVEAPTDIGGIQVYTENGYVCGTYLQPIKQGEKVVLNCIEAFVDRNTKAYVQIYEEGTGNITEIAQAFRDENPTQNFLWWWEEEQFNIEYDDEYISDPLVLFERRHISGQARDDSITELFDAYRNQVLIQHRFPNTSRYRDRCEARGYQVQSINVTDTADQLYLRDFHRTHLSARRCTGRWQCETFARSTNVECVPDQTIWSPWRNGDDTKYPFEGYGDEGGCACHANHTHGFFSLQNMCDRCQDGFGPFSDTDWLRAIQFQEEILAEYPSLPPPSFNNLTWASDLSFEAMKETVTCRLPWDASSTRKTGLCGGYGNLTDLSLEKLEWSVVVFVDELGIKESRRCTTLVIDEEFQYTLNNETLVVDLFSYGNGSNIINVIGDRVFLDGGQREITLSDSGCLDSCTYRDSNDVDVTVTCGYSPREKDGFQISTSSQVKRKSFLYNYFNV